MRHYTTQIRQSLMLMQMCIYIDITVYQCSLCVTWISYGMNAWATDKALLNTDKTVAYKGGI